MKIRLIVCVVLIAPLVAGCGYFFNPIVGSGFPEVMDYPFSDFSRIEAGNAFRVHIIPDSSYSVQVTCDDNLVSYLVVTQENDAVKLHLKDFYYYYNIILTAEIHLPALSRFDLSGASQARIDAGFPSPGPFLVCASGASSADFKAFECGALAVDVSGASTVSVSDLAADSLECVASGASTLSLLGSISGAVTLAVSGASHMKLVDCPAGSADVRLSGASDAWVDVGNGRLTLTASGASSLYYRGSPSFEIIDLSGASSIHKVD
jgi:hypothetical protein